MKTLQEDILFSPTIITNLRLKAEQYNIPAGKQEHGKMYKEWFYTFNYFEPVCHPNNSNISGIIFPSGKTGSS